MGYELWAVGVELPRSSLTRSPLIAHRSPLTAHRSPLLRSPLLRSSRVLPELVQCGVEIAGERGLDGDIFARHGREAERRGVKAEPRE